MPGSEGECRIYKGMGKNDGLVFGVCGPKVREIWDICLKEDLFYFQRRFPRSCISCVPKIFAIVLLSGCEVVEERQETVAKCELVLSGIVDAYQQCERAGCRGQC